MSYVTQGFHHIPFLSQSSTMLHWAEQTGTPLKDTISNVKTQYSDMKSIVATCGGTYTLATC